MCGHHLVQVRFGLPLADVVELVEQPLHLPDQERGRNLGVWPEPQQLVRGGEGDIGPTDGDGLYAQRRATTLVFGAFLTDFYALVASWAEWAEGEVASWPEDIASARVSPERTREVRERARWSQRPH